MASMAEQQRLLRAALGVLGSQRGHLIDRATRDTLRFAIVDHDDPDELCAADTEVECFAVTAARRVLANQLEPEEIEPGQ